MIKTRPSGVYNALRVSALYVVITLFSVVSFAQHNEHNEPAEKEEQESEKVDAISHILDSHEWHVWTTKEGPVSIPLPIVLYSSDNGFEVFSSSNFHHGEHAHLEIGGKQAHGYVYDGYFTDHHMKKIYAVEKHGEHYKINESRGFYDFSITKNVVSMLLSVLILFFIFFAVKKGYRKNKGGAPKGIQSFFEPIIIFVRDDIAKDSIGEKRYQKFVPYLLTIFFFIWFNNLLGLVPAAANVTGNIAVTLILALFTMLITLVNGNKNYWSHIFDPLGGSMAWGAKLPLYLILWPIEIIGIFTKPLSLMIRLFANISAGHILILSIIGMTFMAQSFVVGGVAAVFASIMNMLELFVALLQAYVFTLLTAMYFGQAVEEAHH